MTLTTFRNYAVAVALIAQAVSTAQAGPIYPASTSFGPLPSATFGGSGISNSSVAITTIHDRDNTITLGMTAVARYFNPAVGNNGAGDFYATVGLNDGLGGPSLGATWNFAFYIDVDGPGTLQSYNFSLLYDLNPSVDTLDSDHGQILLSNAFAAPAFDGIKRAEDSQNLYFSFLSSPGIGGLVNAPSGTFDPLVTGQYTFSLKASNGESPLGESNIRVTVNTVPEPSTIALIALSLLSLFGFGALRRRGVA